MVRRCAPPERVVHGLDTARKESRKLIGIEPKTADKDAHRPGNRTLETMSAPPLLRRTARHAINRSLRHYAGTLVGPRETRAGQVPEAM
jgi:hypothetical protein